VECYKSNDSFDKVECCFDKVERCFNIGAGVDGALDEIQPDLSTGRGTYEGGGACFVRNVPTHECIASVASLPYARSGRVHSVSRGVTRQDDDA